MEEDGDVLSTMAKVQEATSRWGDSLMAVGGEFKADKCAYTVHNMVPAKNGTWEYREVTKGNE